MKRHITKLEQSLLDSGWKLLYKTYKGKNSQFVCHYVYGKIYGDRGFKLSLDQKRNHMVKLFIENNHTDYIDVKMMNATIELYNKVYDEIRSLEFVTVLDEEEEIVEILENENE